MACHSPSARNGEQFRGGKDQSGCLAHFDKIRNFQKNLRPTFIKHIYFTIHPFYPPPWIWKDWCFSKWWEEPEKAEAPGTQISQEQYPRILPGKAYSDLSIGQAAELGAQVSALLTDFWSESQSLPYPGSLSPFFPGYLLFILHSGFPHLTVTASSVFLFLETNQNPKLQSIPYGHQHVPRPSALYKHRQGTPEKWWASQEWVWEVWNLGLLGSYLCLTLLLLCPGVLQLLWILLYNGVSFSFFFSKLVRNFWMQRSFSGKRK